MIQRIKRWLRSLNAPPYRASVFLLEIERGETIRIGDVTVCLDDVDSEGNFHFAIAAPPGTPIHREEDPAGNR